MAAKATQPTLGDWWREMLESKGSDLQMPVYMVYVWVFAKIFGFSEWSLRAANIPWFVTGTVAFIGVFPRSKKITVAAVTLSAPFAWYYLNEARPYTMQLGASLMVVAGLYRLSNVELPPRREAKWFGLLCFGLISLCGSSLLGVIWAGAALFCAPILFSGATLWSLVNRNKSVVLLTVVLLALLGGYYVWTLRLAAHGMPAGKSGTGNPALVTMRAAANFRTGLAGGTDFRNLAFLGYEILGFGGLGPGRLSIREEGLAAFHPYVIPLIIYGLLWVDLLLLTAKQFYKSPQRDRNLVLTVLIILPIILLVGAGYFLSFRILGRHLTPILPILILTLSVGLGVRWSRLGWLSKCMVGLFLCLSLISCLSFRFAARHMKDDYRDAANAAKAALARGQRVWWSADTYGAKYYQVPLINPVETKSGAVLIQNGTTALLSSLPLPDIIIASKPDLYDEHDALGKLLKGNAYTKSSPFQAFNIWINNDLRPHGQN